MAGRNNRMTASELKDLRALRALVLEAHGVLESMNDLVFAAGLPCDDALAAFGLANSEWARERMAQIRKSLDVPIEVSALDRNPESALVDAA